MLIQLKQAEITQALKQYIVSQGISIVGKDVNIAFTAGRKETGLIADISVEDVIIPFDDGPEVIASSTDVPPGPVASSTVECKPEPAASLFS